MKTRTSLALASATFLVCQLGIASAQNEEDPRYTTVDYRGAGIAERAPDYGEANFSFNVACLASANEVREAISAVSTPVWNEILTQVPVLENSEEDLTESRARFSGEIGNIQERPGARFVVQPPRFDPETKEVIDGSVKRINVCTDEEVALNAAVGSVFSGSQSFGVRTENLDWVEALVRTVNNDPRRTDESPDAVKFAAGRVQYKLTKATKIDMLVEVQEEARDAATGDKSLFADDKDNLRLESARFLDRFQSGPSPFRSQIGKPVKRGEAPKVSLEVNYSFSTYGVASDVIELGAEERDGGVSQYQVTGSAILDADYAESAVVVSSSCHSAPELASAAVAGTAEGLAETLRTFHGDQEPSETDRVVNNEPSAPSASHPYIAINWDTTDPDFPATQFLNTCNNTVVAAPESGRVFDLPAMWSAQQVLTVKSSRFLGLLNLIEGLQAEFDNSQSATDAVFVDISDATGGATVATEQELERLARASAIEEALDGAGQVASDARAFELKSVFFRGLHESFRGGFGGVLENAPVLSSASRSSLADEADTLEVEVVVKPNSERPAHRIERSYTFRYEVRSENYAPAFLSWRAQAQR